MKKKIKTGNKTTDKLYEAVRDYVEERGGTVVVIGGVQMVQMPDDLAFNWGLNVRITGKKLDFADKEELKDNKNNKCAEGKCITGNLGRCIICNKK